MIFLYIIVGWFLLIGSFVMVMHAKRLIDEGTAFTVFWKVNLLPWAVVGVLLDFAFNVVAGTLMFAEFPDQALFTTRCRKHKDDTGWRGNVARWWQKQLNQIDPGHV